MIPISDQVRILDAPEYHGFFTREFTSSNTATGPWQFRSYIAGGADDQSSEGTGSGDGDQGDEGSQDAGATGGDEGSSDESKKFSQDDVNRLIAKEKSRALRGKIDPKEFGFDSQKELQEFVEQQKQKSEAQKTEDEKARQTAIDEAKETAKTEILDKSKQLMLRAEFKVSAREAGVPKDALEDAYLLAQTMEDWSDVEVTDDGAVSGLTADFFKDLKEAKPFLFPEQKTEGDNGKPGDIGQRSGGGKTGPGGSDDELVAKYPGLRMS